MSPARDASRVLPWRYDQGRQAAQAYEGTVDILPPGSIRVRVYAGIDAVSRQRLYHTNVIPPGANAAEKARTRFLRQVDEQRSPRTRNCSSFGRRTRIAPFKIREPSGASTRALRHECPAGQHRRFEAHVEAVGVVGLGLADGDE